jgi:hypothetical protein
MFKKFVGFVILPLLLFALVTRTISLINESREQGFLAVTLSMMVGFLVLVGLIIYIAHYRLKKQARYIEQLRQEKPVAYVCSFPLSSKVNFVSSDDKELTIWDVVRGQLVPVAMIVRDDVTFSKGPVQVAVLRSVEGVVITDKKDPSLKFELNLCRDNVNLMLPSLKEPQLSEAISRLQNGK